MIFLAVGINPVSSPMSGTSAFPFGCELSIGRWIGLLSSKRSESLSIRTGSTTAGAIVQWLRMCCSTPGVELT